VISDVPVRGLQHEDRSGKLGFTSVAIVRRDKDMD